MTNKPESEAVEAVANMTPAKFTALLADGSLILCVTEREHTQIVNANKSALDALRGEVAELREANQLYSFAMNTAGIDELKRRPDAAERRVGELENPGQQDDYLDALDALWRIQGNDGPIYKMFLAFVNRVIPLTGADPT